MYNGNGNSICDEVSYLQHNNNSNNNMSANNNNNDVDNFQQFKISKL